MKKVFIGGSRRVSRLNDDVRSRIDRIIDQSLPVIVGDANGADKAVQHYLHSKNYRLVEVFCSGGRCRNNVGNWPVRSVQVERDRRDFAFYATKDREMTNEAAYGLMLWDGKSKGTLLNVLRLARQNKRVVIYNSSANEFAELRRRSDWDSFAEVWPVDTVKEVERKAASEGITGHAETQPALF